jgi:hypothetical protein
MAGITTSPPGTSVSPPSSTASRHGLFRAQSLGLRELSWQGHPAVALGLPVAFTTLASVALAAALPH